MSPLLSFLMPVTWAAGPGWYGVAPLALKARVDRMRKGLGIGTMGQTCCARRGSKGARVFLPASARIGAADMNVRAPFLFCRIPRCEEVWAFVTRGPRARSDTSLGQRPRLRDGIISEGLKARSIGPEWPASGVDARGAAFCRSRNDAPLQGCGDWCTGNLGRWPRLVWGRAVGARGPGWIECERALWDRPVVLVPGGSNAKRSGYWHYGTDLLCST
jgi:hypothetical protein